MKPKLNPELAKVHPIWKQIKILKEEDRACYSKFIIPLPNESKDGKKEREDSFTLGFYNPSQMLLRAKGDAVYKKKVQRDNLSPSQEAFVKAADRSQQGLTEMMHNEVAPCMAAYGTVFAVMDKPKVEVATKEEELLRRRPFLTILNQEQPIDFAYGEDGQLLWFMYYVDAPMDRSDPWNPKRAAGWKADKGIATFTRTAFSVKAVTGKNEFYVPEMENPFGFVPVIIQAQYVEPNKTIGASTFFSSSDYLLMGNNLDNASNQEVFKNASATLTMNAQDWDDEQQPTNERSPDSSLRILNRQAHDFKNVLLYQKDKPDFMTRNLDLIEKAGARADKYFDRVFENEKHALSVQNAEVPQSGVSKSYDFIDINEMLAGFAAAMERFERQAIGMAADMTDEDNSSIVNYAREYDARTYNQRLEFIKGLRDAGFPSKLGLREAFKTLTPEISADEKTQVAINAEIDAADPAPAADKKTASEGPDGKQPPKDGGEGKKVDDGNPN